MGCCIKPCKNDGCLMFVKNFRHTFCSRACFQEWRRKHPQPPKPRNRKHRNYRQTKWATEVRRRSNGLCVECGQPAVDSHHIIPLCVDSSKAYDTDNGVALCLSCHHNKHKELPIALFTSRFKLPYKIISSP